ncbi:hypothetical protein JTB14_035746 [Gonioctena quinquepunctata]|nr:hypothetical protein JTB14_035746 [Gonioctena quinquepunctata]
MEQDRYSLINQVNSNHESGYESVDVRGSSSTLENKPAKFQQYFAALAATFSAVAAGTVLGWTSPILDDLKAGKYHNIPLDNNQLGWTGSFATLGGMAMCIPTGFLCDIIGRKKTLLSLVIPLPWVGY